MPDIWPDLQAVLSFDTGTGTGLISLVTVGLWLLGAWTGVYALLQWLRCRKSIQFYDEFLDGVSEEEFLGRRALLRDEATEAGALGRLWIEFDDTLVSAPDGSRVFQSVAAETMFHDGTLNGPLVRSALLDIMPVFLLLLGIAGSFAALLLGNVAAAAFAPTLWGVIVSALVFILVKGLQRLVSGPVVVIQTRIDALFSSLTSEQVLSKIADHSRTSAASLQEMITILEQQMEMILARTRQAVRFEHNKSLEQILAPGVGTLIGDLNAKSEVLMSEIKTSYLDEAEDVHKLQSMMLSDAIQSIKDDTEQMGLEIANFFVQVDQQFRTVDAAAGKRQEEMEARLNEAMAASQSELEARLKGVAVDSQSVKALLKGEMAEQIKALEGKDSEREKRLFDEIKRVCELQASLAARVDALMERQDQDFQAMQTIVRTIVAGFKSDSQPPNPNDLQRVPQSTVATPYESRK